MQVIVPLNTCHNAFCDGFIRMTSAAHSCPVNASILGSLNNLQAYSAALAIATQSHSIRFTVSDGKGACPHNPCTTLCRRSWMLKQAPGVHRAGSCQRGEKPILPPQTKKPHGRRSGAPLRHC